MAGLEQFSLRWNNFHSNLSTGFHDLLKEGELVDVTLATEGKLIKAHQVVLSVCSPFFRKMFQLNPCKHPIVILTVGYRDLRDILTFIYQGEVNVHEEDLPGFLKAAELLQIKGLTGDDSDEPTESVENTPLPETKLTADVEKLNNKIHVPETVIYEQPKPALKRLPFESKPAACPTSNIKRKRTSSSLKNALPRKPVAEKLSPKEAIKDCTETPKVGELPVENNESAAESQAKSSASDDEEQLVMDLIPSKIEINDEMSDSENYQMKPDSELDDFMANPVSQSSSNVSTDKENGWLYSGDIIRTSSCFPCPLCNKKFVNRYNVKVHVRDKHEPGRAVLSCEICGKVMRNKSCLRVHKYNHRKQHSQTL